MKKLISVLIYLSLVVVMGCGHNKNETTVYLPNENCKLVSFKSGSEPDGFNGIKWKTETSTLQGMMIYRTDPSHGGIVFYVKQGDAFKLGNGKLNTPQYGFWGGKFYVGMVTTQGLSNWNALKEAVFNKYGEGAKPFRNQEEYLWVGKNATMALWYNGISNEGFYYIRSESIAKEMKD